MTAVECSSSNKRSNSIDPATIGNRIPGSDYQKIYFQANDINRNVPADPAGYPSRTGIQFIDKTRNDNSASPEPVLIRSKK